MCFPMSRDLSFNLELPQYLVFNKTLNSLRLVDVRGNRLLASALVDFLKLAPRASVRVDEGTTCCVIEMEWQQTDTQRKHGKHVTVRDLIKSSYSVHFRLQMHSFRSIHRMQPQSFVPTRHRCLCFADSRFSYHKRLGEYTIRVMSSASSLHRSNLSGGLHYIEPTRASPRTVHIAQHQLRSCRFLDVVLLDIHSLRIDHRL